MSDLVLVADVHLVEDDPELPAFESFIRSLAGNTRTCVIIGDLFNVWIAPRRFTTQSQRRLLGTLGEVSRQGVEFKYVEGNRDYFVAEAWAGEPFSEVASSSLIEAAGPIRLLISHGDLVNRADRQYRAWRAFSRSLPVRAGLALLSSRLGQRLASDLERKLRGTNTRHKMSLPAAELRAYLRRAVESGHGGVVLGHFHHELEIKEERGGSLWILPDWKAGHRYLRFGADGVGRFVAFGAGAAAHA